jgi:hypothetical protein
VAYPLWSYQVAIDLDHFAATAEQRAAPKCSSRSAPERPSATANDITDRAKDLQRPCCHLLRIRRLGSRVWPFTVMSANNRKRQFFVVIGLMLVGLR